MTIPTHPVSATGTSLTDVQRAVLAALVDTVVPALPVPPDATDPTFWTTSATAVGAHLALEELLVTTSPPEQLAGVAQLLDGLAGFGFAHQGLAVREVMLATLANTGELARLGIQTLRGAAAMIAYALPDEGGRNPFWPQLGYPGPLSPPPQVPKTITPHTPTDGEVLTADVVVVGSGAGGGTVAGVLAQAGKSVVVLEAGGYRNEADFVQLELVAGPAMFLRGGLFQTADQNMAILAGSTLGGGTTVNWQNCVQPSALVRRQWATEYGLEGLDTEEFDRHLAAVLARMKANADCSDHNGPHARMREGAERLGWSWHVATRNVDPDAYDPDYAGYTHFGDQTGAKLGTLKTYLQDAADAGATIMVNTKADQVCTADGRATGVAAVHTDPATGATARVTVNAPTVVVAAGALETPVLLLRSGLGGPAVGDYLRLHPSAGLFGTYAEDQRPWWGPPQAGVMNEFADIDDGYGFLVEGSQYYTGLFAYQLTAANTSGRAHKQAMSELARTNDNLFIVRDIGHGRVTLGPDGEGVHTYALTEPLDQRHFAMALDAAARLHEAAGAQQITATAPGLAPWRRGEDLEAWLERLTATPVGAAGILMGSAHQMGTARMGRDPATSVADPRGQVHDTPGVWVGDTSAFPTPSGANPMLTCMALAHRTAEMILGRPAGDDAVVDLDRVAEPVL